MEVNLQSQLFQADPAWEKAKKKTFAFRGTM